MTENSFKAREGGANEALAADYAPLAGAADELIGPDGQVREVWRNFLDYLKAMTPGELRARMARADVYLRDAGVFYRQYDDPANDDRDRALSHLPVLIKGSEWDAIATGLAERAELLERVVADLYGENRLVRDGHLPAELVVNNDEWLRPLVSSPPRCGHWLHFIAFDIGRSPEGQWWVLADKTQVPSGSGFALENRIATARAFANAYQRSNVLRLASFFREFRDAIGRLRPSPDTPLGMLSPGQSHDSYYEHAFISRYLGLVLLQGEDLVVRDGQVLVRTVAGLQQIEVLWRRVDSALTDPLELRDDTSVGVAGLVSAVRDGDATLINNLGTGVLETRALLAFLPKLNEVMLGKPFSLPNVATWWCGDRREREYVKQNARNMTISHAWAGDRNEAQSATAGDFLFPTDESIEHWIENNAANLVGQEAITLSTTPVIEAGRLVPRPMTLRAFAARTPNGWKIMPGGYARIGRSGDVSHRGARDVGSVADVWIMSDKPVVHETLLDTQAGGLDAHVATALPSRAADNLLWLGRYTERAENQVRFLRAYHYRLAESDFGETRLLENMVGFMEKLDLDVDEPATATLNQTLRAAIRCTGRVRDRISVDAWRALNELKTSIDALPDELWPGEDTGEAMNYLLRQISGFAGLVHENMYRSMGWRFLSLGRSMERAVYMCELLGNFTSPDVPGSRLDLMLELGDSSMTYRSRYAGSANRESVIELLALDALNPRAVLYQLQRVNEHVAYLPGSDAHHLSPLQRSAFAVQAALTVDGPDAVTDDRLKALAQSIAGLASDLAGTYLN